MPDSPAITPYGPEDADALVELWTAEGRVARPEAERRLSEVLLVARADGLPAGVTTAYLAHHPQLQMPLWHGRVFVAEAHRRGELAIRLAGAALDLLRDRWVRGEDTRAGGMVFEVESEILKRYLPLARWHRTGFTFVGLNPLGAHVRVVYFPGVEVPAQGSA